MRWRHQNISENQPTYRYGFNGMEIDDEMKGIGNSYDFGARMYDPRLGRWFSVDPKYHLQPSWSTYKFAMDNPLIYLDPEGETEFYFKGVWVGTDGNDNNAIGVVTKGSLARKMKRASKKGRNYKNSYELKKGAERVDGILLVNRDVLAYVFNFVTRVKGPRGERGEYGNSMRKMGDGDHYEPVLDQPTYAHGAAGGVPEKGEVGIHSHPTGIYGNMVFPANEASPDKVNPDGSCDPADESLFVQKETNIIVGKNGGLSKDSETGAIKDKRSFAINFWGNSMFIKLGSINAGDATGGGEAEQILKGRVGRIAEKFNQKQAEN